MVGVPRARTNGASRSLQSRASDRSAAVADGPDGHRRPRTLGRALPAPAVSQRPAEASGKSAMRSA